jgi:hypothetical protein
MAVIAPNTDLYLLKVPLEINDINQLDFASKTAQYNYFNSLPKLEVEDYTYQRKDNTIRFGGNFDELITYNYVMYRNTEYSDKWFYAFITDMQYVNDNMTMITIKSDVWQCWQFDLNFKPCLVEREHTNDDTIGSNILPEGLELGEFITNGVTDFYTSSNYIVVAEVSQVENEGTSQSLSYTWETGLSPDLSPDLNDIPRGTIPLILQYGGTQQAPAPKFDKLREIYDKAGLGNSIVNVYVLPKDYITILGQLQLNKLTIQVLDGDGNVTDSIEHVGVPYPTSGTYLLNTSIFTRPTDLAGYHPVNNKLYTFPFCYFNISNNAGTSIPYHYEDFNGEIQFEVRGTFGLSGNLKAIPKNYKNIGSRANALDYSITGGKYPVGSWASDSYTNWLTQNAVNMQTQWKSAIVQAGADIASGAIVGGGIGVAGGLFATASNFLNLAREQMLAKTSANMVSDQVQGNLNAGDFVWAECKTPFTYMGMCVKPQIARCIDNYFSMFGYATRRVKLPNRTGRRNWNYVKTIGCYIEADIPQNDLAEIKGMFDNGITIWHNPAYFGDYSQNNDILT